MTSSLLVLVVVSQVFLHVQGGCEFDGQVYPYGDVLNDLCAPMICVGISDEYIDGWNWTGTFNPDCENCTAYCDPHVITFDQTSEYHTNFKSYSYQGCGNYVMVQPGFTRAPAFGVFATFDEYCGRDVSCVSNVTFIQDGITIIAKSPEASKNVTVEIDGMSFSYSDAPESPSFVRSGNDKVMGWKDSTFDNKFHWGPNGPDANECVFFQGTKGLLIVFCGNEWANTLYIWAMPNLNNQVNGLCGTITGDIYDDYKPRVGPTFQYNHAHPPLSTANLNIWAKSWLTISGASTQCPYRGRRSIQDKETTCIDFDTHHANCKHTIVSLGSGLTDYEIEAFTDDCTFDLCHVYDSAGYLHGAVASFVNITSYFKSITITEEVATTLKPTTTDSSGDRIVVQVMQKVN